MFLAVLNYIGLRLKESPYLKGLQMPKRGNSPKRDGSKARLRKLQLTASTPVSELIIALQGAIWVTSAKLRGGIDDFLARWSAAARPEVTPELQDFVRTVVALHPFRLLLDRLLLSYDRNTFQLFWNDLLSRRDRTLPKFDRAVSLLVGHGFDLRSMMASAEAKQAEMVTIVQCLEAILTPLNTIARNASAFLGSARRLRSRGMKKSSRYGEQVRRDEVLESLLPRLRSAIKGERSYQEWRGQIYAIWSFQILIRELTPRIRDLGGEATYLLRRLDVLGMQQLGELARIDFLQLPEHLFTT